MKSNIPTSKHILLCMMCLFYGVCTFSQVKIGSNPTVVNPNAVLEIESSNKGFLLPRLNLTSTTATSPLTAFVEGMLVYNTATTGDVTPGLYYSDGSKWVKITNVNNGELPTVDSWLINGNGGTTPGINFIGTKDYTDLIFKTNSLERLRLTKDGWLGIGTATPSAALHVKGQVKIDSLHSGNLGTDSLLVAAADGTIKKVNGGQLSAGVKKTSIIIAATGQVNFTTPATISNPDKIMLYRNGILIGFTVSGANTIVAEIAAVAGDEIKIVQVL